jgi:hypothetical protein
MLDEIFEHGERVRRFLRQGTAEGFDERRSSGGAADMTIGDIIEIPRRDFVRTIQQGAMHINPGA